MKNRIPPPILMLIGALLVYFVDVLYPMSFGGAAERLIIAAVSLLFAFVFLANSIIGFIRSKTTVNPLQPERASSLVTTGVFRFSRNPMYLGMLLCLFAWTIYLGNVLGLIGPVLFGITINVLQIAPEEKALSEKFGQSYLAYCNKVRRWL